MKKMEKIGLPVFCIVVALVVLVNGASAENMDISPPDQMIPYADDFATYDVRVTGITSIEQGEHTISASIKVWGTGTDKDLLFKFTNSTGASDWMESGEGWNWGTPACNGETITMYVKANSTAPQNNEYRFYVQDTTEIFGVGVSAGGTVAGYTGMYPCGECGCSGKVTDLTLKYTGAGEVFVEVFQKKIEVPVFTGMVTVGVPFSFSGVDKKGTLGKEIAIKVGGEVNTKIHTSCSKPIGPGLVSGDFEVIAGTSKDGGILCPLSSECVVNAAENLEFKGTKVKWAITNGGDYPLIVESIKLTDWPEDANGKLKKEKLKDIKPGKTGKLELEFENDAVPGVYEITVTFDGDCTINFPL